MGRVIPLIKLGWFPYRVIGLFLGHLIGIDPLFKREMYWCGTQLFNGVLPLIKMVLRYDKDNENKMYLANN